MRKALWDWMEQGMEKGGPPAWATKLSRQIGERLEVLRLVPPTAEEAGDDGD